ncbi:MAG TPA: hypothetical protein VKE74_00125 [Gemmataceae bacterium]|nr:hypothetical protein [Gemmataceae bacterium]
MAKTTLTTDDLMLIANTVAAVRKKSDLRPGFGGVVATGPIIGPIIDPFPLPFPPPPQPGGTVTPPPVSAIDPNIVRALYADPGDVIRSDRYNALIDILLSLVAAAGGKPPGQPEVITLPPAFVRHKGGPDWVIDAGSATPTVSGDPPAMQADGLIPILLPAGSRVQSMAVFGSRPAQLQLSSFEVKLACRELKTGEVVELVVRNLDGGDDPFDKEGPVRRAAGELSHVNPTEFHYFVTATCRGAAPGQNVAKPAITGIRIKCGS